MGTAQVLDDEDLRAVRDRSAADSTAGAERLGREVKLGPPTARRAGDVGGPAVVG